MWSGKTTELLRLYDRKLHAGIKCLLIKHRIDQRYEAPGAVGIEGIEGIEVITHANSDGKSGRAPAMVFATIGEVISHLSASGAVSLFIDEIQFFPDKERCIELMDAGIDVVAAGLNGDYNRRLFDGMGPLLAAASEIKMLTAICEFCKSDGACYTKRISTNTDVIDVGGSDKYRAACLKCFI